MDHANGLGRLQVVRSMEHAPIRSALDSSNSSDSSVMPIQAPAAVTKRIGILIFEDFSLVEVSSISEVFSIANQIGEGAPPHETQQTSASKPNYSLMFVSSEGGSVASTCSMRIWTESLETRWMSECDALFIAGGRGARRARQDTALRKRLGRIAPRVPFIKAIGEGAHILAAANLASQNRAVELDGEHAEAALSSAFSPALSNAMYIAEPTLTLDDPKGPIAAALSIVKRDHGAALARDVSERTIPGAWNKLAMVLEDTETGGVRQKIESAARWIRENYVRPISIADAARVAAMSERNFLRRFKAQIGLTPSEYLLRARLDASCMLLAATDLPVDKIARRCGAGSGDGLAKIFRKRLLLSPTEYRQAGRSRQEDSS